MLNLFRFIYYNILFVYKNIRSNIFVNRNDLCDRSKFVLIVSPWHFSATPFYFLKLGAFLNSRKNKVTYIFDDIEYDLSYKINCFILKISLNLLRVNYYKLTDFPESTSSILDDYSGIFNDIVYENLVATFRGEVHNERTEIFRLNYLKKLSENYLKVIFLFEEYNDYSFVIPGGSLGTSGLLVRIADKFNVNYSTIDSGFQFISICNCGIASKNQFISDKSMSLLFAKSQNDFNLCLTEAKDLLENRKNPKYVFQFQATASIGKYEITESYFVLFLNIVWDGAAFVKDFRGFNYLNSIKSFVEYFLVNSIDKLVIRQHPDERKWWGKSNFVLNEFFSDFDSKYPNRLVFLTSIQEVNSYDLISSSKGVFVWSSTIGLESIMMKKQTMFLSINYVYNCPELKKFVFTQEEQLSRFLTNCDDFAITDNDLLFASNLFLITQKYSWFPTIFTPQTVDFLKWVTLDDTVLTEDYIVIKCLESLEVKNSLTDYYLENNII